MGHESLGITDRLYGKLAGNDVKDVVIGLSREEPKMSEDELFLEFIAFKKWLNSNGKI